MTTRKRKNHLNYQSYTDEARGKPCEFCKFSPEHEQVVKENKHFFLSKNIFPYDMWDICGVTTHLMVVPKRHVDTISHFSSEEQKSYIKLLAEYEQVGYSIYARAPGSVAKSIIHQHTHLIKLDNKKKKIILFIRKPWLVLSK